MQVKISTNFITTHIRSKKEFLWIQSGWYGQKRNMQQLLQNIYRSIKTMGKTIYMVGALIEKMNYTTWLEQLENNAHKETAIKDWVSQRN